jgi:hypothetical protein
MDSRFAPRPFCYRVRTKCSADGDPRRVHVHVHRHHDCSRCNIDNVCFANDAEPWGYNVTFVTLRP